MRAAGGSFGRPCEARAWPGREPGLGSGPGLARHRPEGSARSRPAIRPQADWHQFCPSAGRRGRAEGQGGGAGRSLQSRGDTRYGPLPYHEAHEARGGARSSPARSSPAIRPGSALRPTTQTVAAGRGPDESKGTGAETQGAAPGAPLLNPKLKGSGPQTLGVLKPTRRIRRRRSALNGAEFEAHTPAPRRAERSGSSDASPRLNRMRRRARLGRRRRRCRRPPPLPPGRSWPLGTPRGGRGRWDLRGVRVDPLFQVANAGRSSESVSGLGGHIGNDGKRALRVDPDPAA